MHRVDPFDPGIAVALSSFENKANVFRNLDAPRLYEEAIRRGEAEIADGGALVAATGAHTGRSPHDKFIVRDEFTRAAPKKGCASRRPLSPPALGRPLCRDILRNTATFCAS